METNNLNRLTRLPACAAKDTTGWATRHLQAIHQPRAGLEQAYVEMLRGWLRYADAHQKAYGSGIGEDGFLGPEWARIGSALRTLLNGEVGRMDCGTLDGILANTLEAQAFDPETL